MRIQRPVNLSDSPLLDDLIGTYSRQYSDETEFLEKHDLHLACCRDQVGSKKKDLAERRVVSVSSASATPMYYKMIYYTAGNTNVILMRVKANLKCSFRNLLRYKEKWWSYHIPKKAVTKESDNRPVTSNPSAIRFDPANMYRS